MQAAETEPSVNIIDDDEDIRAALTGLLRSVGLRVRPFASVAEFRAAGGTERAGCLVLDVRLPGRSGLDFHDELLAEHLRIPVIFISGHADVPMSVRAMKAGAVEFLTKPLRHQDLLDAIQRALAQDRAHRTDRRIVAALQANFDRLTAREREVMMQVVAGRLNKQIAYGIGLSEATVKIHRGQVMRKMQAQSVADLVRMADRMMCTTPHAGEVRIPSEPPRATSAWGYEAPAFC